jgi:hypothetical protein
MTAGQRKTLRLILIKPSHYDDDGYPITWWRSLVPSNTMAALYGIADDCQRRQVLGPDVEIVLESWDDTNRHIEPAKIIRRVKRSGEKALVCLVGVQSNQFPRACDLAQPFLKAGLPVILGGFHVAGCLSMLKELPAEIQEAMDDGISMFAGEAEEGRLDQVLQDAWTGSMKPLYNYIDDLPGLEGQPTPHMPKSALKFNNTMMSSFDLGRGCPFQCSFCTIINVQGRKSRFRTADDLEKIIRDNAAQGINAFFITDDNLARNRLWEEFFDRLIDLRWNHGLTVDLLIQVDTQCHKIPNFIRKARDAGVSRVFIGLENINPDNLMAAKKRQNKITDYRTMLQAWHRSGAYTWAGYIIGFPQDTKESLMRDIAIIQKELPLDILEFFVLTPLPGSEDHRTLLNKGEWMDPDLNKFDTFHRVTHHPKMSDQEWDEAYQACWKNYYTWEHIETVARRHGALPDGRPEKASQFLTEFKVLFEVENIHPLDGGIFRLKFRKDRRPGMPLEWPGLFHAKLAVEFVRKLGGYLASATRAAWIAIKVNRDPKRREYMDLALTPVAADDFEKLSIFSDTAGGEAAVAKRRNEDAARARVAAQKRVAAAE